MNRKSFLKHSILASGMGMMSLPLLGKPTDNDKFNLEEIRELVFAAHKDFDATKKLIENNPLLINCTNQSKRGDFETAIGGASHMGRKDIADFLVERGARLDIFNLTFLGHTNLVKELINISPQYLTSYGPHGFTLLHHAKAGKHTDFALWLEDQGLTKTHMKIF